MECCPTEFNSNSEKETIDFGEYFASLLKQGSVIALSGGLGAGKTCFVKGIALALSIPEIITSPTYTIINEYKGILKGSPVLLCHIDAYRLAGDEDFNSTGAQEYFYGNNIVIIEWSESIPNSIPAGAITVSIEITGPQSRFFQIKDKQ